MFSDHMLKKISIKVVVLILFILTLGSSFYFQQKYQSAKKLLQNARQPAQLDKEKLIKEVGKLIELPKEEATVAVISDREKLKDQPFFQNAKNGDKVLIFTNAKKAILYRPSTHKIIEVAPINLGSNEASPAAKDLSPSPTKQTKVKIAVYNGTKTSGLAGQAKEKINKELPDLAVVATGNAQADYQETELVDLSGGNSALVNQLKVLFSAKVVTSLPTGEDAAGADIVLLLGE